MENYKTSQELNINDLIFIENKYKSCLSEIVDIKISKSGKFSTIWFKKITESDNNYELGTTAYNTIDNEIVWYISKKITHLYEIV